MNPMSYTDTALALFMEGYNCAQVVFAAFAPVLGMAQADALRVSMGLGGGVGRMREVCGTVSGAAMVIGALYGGDDHKDKTAAYTEVRKFADVFREHHGTIVCRELLHKLPGEKEGPQASERNAAFYAKRPCARLVFDAAQILEDMLRADGKIA